MKMLSDQDQQWIEQRIIEAEQIMKKQKDCTNWGELPEEILSRMHYPGLKVFGVLPASVLNNGQQLEVK
jgi:hypothetical protein